MRGKIFSILFLFILVYCGAVSAQTKNYGSITGVVLDSLNSQPLEFVNVSVISIPQNTVLTGAITGKKGDFLVDNIPFGKYNIKITYVGYNIKEIKNLVIDSRAKTIKLDKILLNNTGVTLNETIVTSNKIMLNNAIDRKIYNVKEDILSSTGTASDLLQNIPSVQVDLDGNVSLRGSGDVMILINGSPSPLMGKTRADVLRQMPANTIEKIEVITNPSAKYKPDGTSGIINIVIKKDSDSGLNGTIGVSASPDDRYNGNISLNYRPGKLNLFGSLSLRKDKRFGFSSDTRTQFDAFKNISGYYFSETNSHIKPVSTGVTIGADYNLDESNNFGISGSLFHRGKIENELYSYLISNKNRTVTSGYDRLRYNDEYEDEYGITAYYEHKFPGEDHNIRMQYNLAYEPEKEDNHYTNVYKIPALSNTYDNTLLNKKDIQNQLELTYSNPLTDKSTLEAGYMGEFNKSDIDNLGEVFNQAANSFTADPSRTNHFIYNESINALYATYSNEFGRFGFLGGLRFEGSYIKANLVSSNQLVTNEYYNVYPTLHLSYKLSDLFQLQLNYSKRAHRPDGEDLSPFSDNEDPRNLRVGNPYLKPEFTHSFEFGLQWNNKLFTVIPSIFYRNRYNAMTSVTKAINDSTLLTTRENLASDHSAGFELVLSGGYDFFTVNLSTMAFLEEIDATNLGYGDKKSTTTWSGNLSCNFNLPSSFMIQINSNYRSARLTPQGESSPSFVLNLGMRKDILDGKVTLIMTVSDLLKTLNRKSYFDTNWLQQNTYSIRDSRIIYFGITYHLGKQQKKEKDLQYDNSL